MRRQLDLKKQGREGLFIFLRDKMRRERIYDAVGIGQ